jgi:hypothetical protein
MSGPGDTFRTRWTGAAIVAAIAIGVYLRVVGLTSSLWLDEFGTFWVVQDGLREAVHRALIFQGQSPLYYLLTWPFPHWLGESEMTLRLPSLVFSVAAVVVAGLAARVLGSQSSGWLCGLALWLSLPLVQAGVNARPYALAMFAMSVMLYGYLAVTVRGRMALRIVFVVGATTLIWTHYVLGLAVPALAIAHLTQRELRGSYPPRKLALDLAVVAGASALLVPQMASLWARRHGLAWITESQVGAIAGGLAPFLVGALIAPAKPWNATRRSARRALWIALGVQVSLVAAAGVAGVNLLAGRYLSVLVVPVALLACTTVAGLPRAEWMAPILCFVAINVYGYAYNHRTVGTFSGAGPENWREAASVLRQVSGDDPDALVLYRSGFVEQDAAPVVNTGVDLAPLRSPGMRPPACRILPLTYRWGLPARAAYFETAVAPAIERAPRFYSLMLSFAEPGIGSYSDRLRQWVEDRWPGRFIVREVPAGRSLHLLVFEPTVRPSSVSGR